MSCASFARWPRENQRCDNSIGLRDRATDRPRDFLAGDETVRVAALGIDDELAAFQVVKMSGLPGIGAAHREQFAHARDHFA